MTATPAPPTPTKPYKAVVAFVLTFLSTILVAIDPAAKHHPVTLTEWVFVIVSSVVTAGTVYRVTNPATGPRVI